MASSHWPSSAEERGNRRSSPQEHGRAPRVAGSVETKDAAVKQESSKVREETRRDSNVRINENHQQGYHCVCAASLCVMSIAARQGDAATAKTQSRRCDIFLLTVSGVGVNTALKSRRCTWLLHSLRERRLDNMATSSYIAPRATGSRVWCVCAWVRRGRGTRWCRLGARQMDGS